MGATGTGKTKLSTDVCKKIGGEVVNADKMQVYAGLDITTNKIRLNDQWGIPHHLIGTISEINDDLSVPFFRSVARRGNILVLVGGLKSLIHGFLADDLDASLVNPFAIASYQPTLRFKSCLLWIKCHELVLKEYLSRCVDYMVDVGLLKELKEYYDHMSIHDFARHTRLARAIGVSELREYFAGRNRLSDSINEMKANTQALAEVQTAKIRHIDAWGWPVCSFDATETIHAHLMESNHTFKETAWEHDVRDPALATVNEFFGEMMPMLAGAGYLKVLVQIVC